MALPGAAVSEADETNPANLLVGVNDDNDDGGPAGSKDNSDTIIGPNDNDIVKAALTSPGVNVGTMEFTVTPASKVQIFIQYALPAGDTRLVDCPFIAPSDSLLCSVDLASPTGDLAGLAAPGGVDLFVEGMESATDIRLKLAYKTSMGAEGPGDEAHLEIAKVDIVADINRDSLYNDVDQQMEENPGALIEVNGDDDDQDGITDYLDGNVLKIQPPLLPMTEDDMLKAKLSNDLPGELANRGKIVLSRNNPMISVFRSPQKGIIWDYDQSILLANDRATWDLANPSERDDLASLIANGIWVEASATSLTLGDIELLLGYLPQGALDTADPIISDRIKISAVRVEVTNIKFNHDTASSANDAINVRMDYNNAYDISNGEWVKGGINIPICYTTNRAVTIEARFTVQPTSILSADIGAASMDSGGSLGDVIKTNVRFSGGVSNPEYVTLNVSGRTPNCVQVTANDVWQWKMENVNGTGPAATDMNRSGQHLVYTILNEPATPWVNTAGNVLNVWTRILDKSCLWAYGSVTGSQVLSSIVTCSYNMGVEYDGAEHYTHLSKTDFHLQSLLDDMDMAGTDYMDCRDFANWTHTLSGSVGQSAEYRVVRRPSSYFTYNYILPSGHSSWNTNNWNYHQVGWWNSKVCDASLKLDNDSDPTQGPGDSNHVEKLSVGDMTQADYLDKLTETPGVTDVETGTCVLQ